MLRRKPRAAPCPQLRGAGGKKRRRKGSAIGLFLGWLPANTWLLFGVAPLLGLVLPSWGGSPFGVGTTVGELPDISQVQSQRLLFTDNVPGLPRDMGQVSAATPQTSVDCS